MTKLSKGVKPFLRWDADGWPILTCPEDGSEMGWLGSEFWLCYVCKLHRIKVGVMGKILRPKLDRQREG